MHFVKNTSERPWSEANLRGSAAADAFFGAEGLQSCEGGAFALDNLVHDGLADDVVDLAAGEVVVGGEGLGIGVGEDGEFALPDALLGLDGGVVETDLEEETTLEFSMLFVVRVVVFSTAKLRQKKDCCVKQQPLPELRD